MSIHGFGDYERDEQDVRERGQQGGPAAAGEPTTVVCGEKIRVATLQPHQMCLLCCCPCCLGPLCSHNRRTNYANMAKTLAACILFVCVALFIVEVAIGGFASSEINPMIGPGPTTLAHMGASYAWRTQNKYEVYRFVSPVFLHAGIFHLLGNMMFLIFYGIPLEQKWGWRRFAIVFFGSGVGSLIFCACVNPDALSVGASGALFGLLGAALAELLLLWARLEPSMRRMQLIQLVILIVVWMLISFKVKVKGDASIFLFFFLFPRID